MPSSDSTERPRVDRSTSPLPLRPANPVQELKALFSEPALPISTTSKETDFHLEAIQCLQSNVENKSDDIPERGSWGSKVVHYILLHFKFKFITFYYLDSKIVF